MIGFLFGVAFIAAALWVAFVIARAVAGFVSRFATTPRQYAATWAMVAATIPIVIAVVGFLGNLLGFMVSPSWTEVGRMVVAVGYIGVFTVVVVALYRAGRFDDDAPTGPVLPPPAPVGTRTMPTPAWHPVEGGVIPRPRDPGA